MHYSYKLFDVALDSIISEEGTFVHWDEQYAGYSRKAINNHMSNLRRNLKIAVNVLNYIRSVYGIGYKFELWQGKRCLWWFELPGCFLEKLTDGKWNFLHRVLCRLASKAIMVLYEYCYCAINFWHYQHLRNAILIIGRMYVNLEKWQN